MTTPPQPSTSPKKRSLMPSGKLRSALRGHGHKLSAIVHIGKGGVTPGLVKQVEQALADHELIKLKVAGDVPGDRFEVADKLAALPGVNVVQIVGGAILLYKRHPGEARYEGNGTKAAAQAAAIAVPAAKAARRRRTTGKKAARAPR